ncbi:MAG: DNA polymerase III subunit alpha [Candidatus Nanopelagicales bacterium]
MSFTHLHVASGFSLRHGADTPQTIVSAAAAHDQPAVALTDRDSLAGAVRFVAACREAGIGAIVGVDLPLAPWTREDVVARDRGLARVVVLARGRGGWAGLCRLTSALHQAGEENGLQHQVFSRINALIRDGGITVLLGPQSDVGAAVAARRPDIARALLAQWQATGCEMVVELVSHRSRDPRIAASDINGAPQRGHAYSTALAARMWQFATDERVPVVLTNAVRHVEQSGARIVDVLDAVRRLVPLDARHLDRSNAEGYLKSTPEMWQVAEEIAEAAGGDVHGFASHSAARHLIDTTEALASRCVLDPIAHVGLGEIHLPELDVIMGRVSAEALNTAWDRPLETHRASAELATEAASAAAVLRARCEEALLRKGFSASDARVRERLEDELATIAKLGFATYFLTVGVVVRDIRSAGIRVAARGSGAGCFVNHLLDIALINPLEHDLLMERFLTPLRRALPDIDIDVESARRLEAYDLIFARFGAARVASVSMMETYRVRHAIRDVGAALGLPRNEIDVFAKAFPHIRASSARDALRELPELRRTGIGKMAAAGTLDELLTLIEGIDRLPRHIALHPCGVLLSDATLRDRTPIQASAGDYPMSQFDKDDVETMGLLKLDVLGIRMQSAMAHAIDEIARTTGEVVELDGIPFDDEATYELIRSTRTLGCFQIESPGQRELVGKFAPENFHDIIVDISLFRPGPVKSDMIVPFLRARQGWSMPEYLHPDLRPALQETCGVVVFHEQVIRMIAVFTGVTLAEADEIRRSLGSFDKQPKVRAWFYPAALRRGYQLESVEAVWEVLRAFASFGFCKAHAAAFAVPTYQSAWLKTHHTAAFFAGVLTHDPGMYPKRLILDDARNFGIPILGLDINRSRAEFVVDRNEEGELGIRIALSQVKGMDDASLESILQGHPFGSLSDFWKRTRTPRPVVENLVLAGAFDATHGVSARPRRNGINRRDLLLHVADLDRWASRKLAVDQLSLDCGPADVPLRTGLPDMDSSERVRAELDVLGLDVSRHVVDFYTPLLDALGVTRSRDLLKTRSRQEILIAGVKVATQTPPIRSGRRVVFLTLDDATGPVDAAFFEDAQGPYASTLFHSWLLLVRGSVRRAGPKGVSITATGCWDLAEARRRWLAGGLEAVQEFMDEVPWFEGDDAMVEGAAASRSSRPVMVRTGGMSQRGSQRVLVHPSGFRQSPWADLKPAGDEVSTGAPGKLWHSSPGSSGW